MAFLLMCIAAPVRRVRIDYYSTVLLFVVGGISPAEIRHIQTEDKTRCITVAQQQILSHSTCACSFVVWEESVAGVPVPNFAPISQNVGLLST